MSNSYQQNAKTPSGPVSATPAGATWGGFRGLLKQYAGAAAGYSLRKIGNGPVVRLRRGSDNAEKDFSAGEVIGSVEGSELIAEPDFETSTGWTNFDGYWTVTGGQAVCDGLQTGYTSLGGSADFPSSEWNILEIDIAACSDFDNVRFYVGSFYSLSEMGLTAPGVVRVLCRNIPTSNFRVDANTGVTCTINRISVKPYTPTASEAWAADNMGGNNRKISELSLDSAYATTWYDQSGSGNNATQATAASQPLLIRAGVTNTENGKPALSFDGVDDDMAAGSGWFPTASDYLASSVFSYSGSAGGDSCLFGTGGAANGFWYVNTDFGTATDQVRVYNDSEVFVGSSLLSAGQVLYSFDKVGDNEGGTYNGVADGTGTRTTTNDDNAFTIASHPTSARLFTGNIQELVVYPSDQSANQSGIEGNINDHYGIY